jgi:hypothetical protein
MSRVNNLLDFCIEKVSEFHTTFGHPIATSQISVIHKDTDLYELRMELIDEEYKEMMDALVLGDRLETLDGILDIFYVAAGAFLVYGLGNTGGPQKYNLDDDLMISASNLESHIKYYLGIALSNYDAGNYKYSFEEAFGDVHASNMSKACKDEFQVSDTINNYADQGIVVTSKLVGDKFIILREDNKILKNKYYTKVDLNKYL